MDPKGRPITVGQLDVGRCYIFHYPHVSTPCLLRNLDRPAIGGAQLRTESGQNYNWQGGVGPHHAVGAYGGQMFERFVEEFSLKLMLELGRTDVDTLLTDSTGVFPVDHYTRNQVMC